MGKWKEGRGPRNRDGGGGGVRGVRGGRERKKEQKTLPLGGKIDVYCIVDTGLLLFQNQRMRKETQRKASNKGPILTSPTGRGGDAQCSVGGGVVRLASLNTEINKKSGCLAKSEELSAQ